MSFSTNQFNYYLQTSHICKKFLIKDGIISSYFEIESQPGFFPKSRWEVTVLKKSAQQIGESISILKNFDYYQYLICTILPDIADTNPFKKIFQKIRFIILISFAKFINLLLIREFESIKKWNVFSKKVLEFGAEIVNSFRQGIKFTEISNNFKLDKEFYNFFNIDMVKIDEELNHYYL